jgi:murein L,D-transpeptidase YcbB/YkuD
LPLVKARLNELGFGFAHDRSVRFSPELKYQLQRWQRKNGYTEDGKLGFESDEMLFLGRSRKLQKLALALERQRWMHQFLMGDRYVWVNLAAARVQLVSADSLVGFNTCSGRRPDEETDMRTPQMLSIVNYALAYPYWVAPTSIGEKELYPAVRKDPGYLKKHHYELVKGNKVVPDSTVNWKRLNPERIPFFFRQTPGLHNALGLMKFNIVNDMSIYMHDTPSKRAFGYSYRWVSHGCVRLEQPLEMARFLLAFNEPEQQRIPEVVYDERKRTESDTFSGNEPVRIMLEEPVPVLFDYRCAWYDEQAETFSYHCDIYDYDAALLSEAHRRGWDWSY